MYKLCQKISQAKQALKKEHFGLIQQKIQALTAKIDRIQQDESTEANLIREMTMRKALQNGKNCCGSTNLESHGLLQRT